MDADAVAITWREAAQIVRSMLRPAQPSNDEWNAALDHASKTLEERATELKRGDTQILSHLRTLFTTSETDRMTTKDILKELEEAGISPDVPLDARRLSRELARYGVQPITFKIGESAVKGYATYPTKTQIGLAAAWRQHLESPSERH